MKLEKLLRRSYLGCGHRGFYNDLKVVKIGIVKNKKSFRQCPSMQLGTAFIIFPFFCCQISLRNV